MSRAINKAANITFQLIAWHNSTRNNNKSVALPYWKMSSGKRTVLITGCSDDSLGAALATAFHEAGLHVYATVRNVERAKQMQALNIEVLTLDVLSEESIKACVSKIPSLDILVNNAGAGYSMPVSDISIAEAKKLFDLNVWSYLAVTQAFLPLLLKSKGMIVNNTSIASVLVIPFQSTYNASKAAMAVFSECQRLELEPFGIRVVELKTGAVASKFFQNKYDTRSEAGSTIPPGSIYEPAKEAVNKTLRGESLSEGSIPAKTWARGVVADLTKSKPPGHIWRGGSALLSRVAIMLPYGMLDGTLKKMMGLDVVAKKVGK